MMLTLAAAFAATDYSGIWNGKGGKEDAKYGKVPATAQMTLLQAGTSLKGTLKFGNNKPVAIASGTVSGSQLTIVVVNNGKQITGSLSQVGTQLSGKMTSSNGQIYDFVFTKN
jgi:citrate lyase synthetase